MQPLGSTLNLQWTRRRGQWAQPMPIKFTTTSTGGRKKRGKKQPSSSPVPTLTRTHALTQAHKRKEGVGGIGARARYSARERKCLQNAGWRLGARGPSAPGRRAGSAAQRERHDGGCGSEPIFWRGSCNDAILRPRVRPLAFSLPFLHVPLRRVEVSRPTRNDFFSYLLVSDSCLLCLPPRETGLVREWGHTQGLQFTCKHIFGV